MLEQLEHIKEDKRNFNFGFLYISDHMAEDTMSIFNLFRSVLRIDSWVGSIGVGVIGHDAIHVDDPGISVMLAAFPDDGFCIFPAQDPAKSAEGKTAFSEEIVTGWLGEYNPVLTVVHADPTGNHDIKNTLEKLEQGTNSFIVGGLTTSRAQHYQIAGSIYHNALSGVFFADTVPVSTGQSQGCVPIGGFHTVTRADVRTILELNDMRAIDVLQNDLSGAVQKDFIMPLATIKRSDDIPDEYKSLFTGRIHAALPVAQSDQQDFMVRNITGIDADEGSISITEPVSTGDRILFVERSQEAVASGLSRMLVNLRKRVQAERGSFEPKGALYVSCIGRNFATKPGTQDHTEITLIKDIIGDIPLTGFYAGGEINNARLYGYTGVLTLFL